MDLVAAPGPGRPADIRVLSGADGSLIRTFRAYDAAFTGGAYVAAGDFTLDGRADILVSPGVGLYPGTSVAPPVILFDGATGGLLGFAWFYDPTFTGGVRVAIADLNGDGYPDLITAPGPGLAAPVRVFNLLGGMELPNPFGYGPGYTGGIFIAAG